MPYDEDLVYYLAKVTAEETAPAYEPEHEATEPAPVVEVPDADIPF